MTRFYQITILLFAMLLLYGESFSRGSAGEKAAFESRYIVDMPTAGVIPKGSFSCYSIAYAGGGIMAELSAAPFENFNFGISFSGTNIIGSGDVTWQEIPGVHLRFRLLDEKLYYPALSIGINTQGRGIYHKGGKRFQTMSPGAFLALSKNFKWALGTIALHGGVNYSFEPPADDRLPNVYFGMEQSLGNTASLNFEFNSGMNDKDEEFMESKGLFNMSLRWSAVPGLTIELQARDLLENSANSNGFTRSICLEYISGF